MSRFIPQDDLSISPLTSSGELVMSRLGSAIQEAENGDMVIVHGSYQVDASDLIKVLKFLDEQDTTLRATTKLGKLADEMRKELHTIWKAVQND